MISPEFVQLSAHYNEWMNNKLYTLCAVISDADRKADRKAFFKSIHGTLNHLLLGDKAWMGRFEGKPFIIKSLDQELYQNFDELRLERQQTDNRIIRWSQNISMSDLSGDLNYQSILSPGQKSCKLWNAVVHLFNHQTHHRGQLTTLLSQMGIDAGVTDILFMPGLIKSI